MGEIRESHEQWNSIGCWKRGSRGSNSKEQGARNGSCFLAPHYSIPRELLFSGGAAFGGFEDILAVFVEFEFVGDAGFIAGEGAEGEFFAVEGAVAVAVFFEILDDCEFGLDAELVVAVEGAFDVFAEHAEVAFAGFVLFLHGVAEEALASEVVFQAEDAGDFFEVFALGAGGARRERDDERDGEDAGQQAFEEDGHGMGFPKIDYWENLTRFARDPLSYPGCGRFAHVGPLPRRERGDQLQSDASVVENLVERQTIRIDNSRYNEYYLVVKNGGVAWAGD